MKRNTYFSQAKPICRVTPVARAGHMWLPLFLLALLLFVWGTPLALLASQSDSTSYTVILNNDGKFQIVQDAYLPSAVFDDLGLKRPGDIQIEGDFLYLADTGNRRCLRVHLPSGEREIFGEGLFRQPTGIAADEDGKIYVADSSNNEAYRFNEQLELEQVFTQPNSPKFGLNVQFRPVKVAPAGSGGVYLINEGSTAGLVHFDGGGAFLGYFGASDVNLSYFDLFLDKILNEEQKKRLLKRTPPSFANIVRGPDGLIYSVNRGNHVTVKKHNISGLNMLLNEQLPEIQSPVALTVSQDGGIYVLDSDGYITEMSKDGYLVNLFAGPSEGYDQAGLFNTPSGIAVDDDGHLYVLDQDRDYLQVFEPTNSQRELHRALTAYGRGDYEMSRKLLRSVTQRNNSSRLAHTYLGKNYMQDGAYEEAAAHFRVAKQIGDYSDAYWEIRNTWIQEHLLYLLIGAALLILFLLHRKRVRKEKNRALADGTYVPNRWDLAKENVRFLHDLSKLPYTLAHPSDQAYEIRVGRTGTWGSGAAILLLFFAILVALNVGSGFIFSVDVKDFKFGVFTAFFFVAVLLFLVSNFLVVAVKDGKGSFRDIFLVLCYSLAPAIYFWPFAILLGNFGTLNDAFFYQLIIGVGLVWSIVSLFVGLSEIHAYSAGDTIKNVLLTLFVMVIIVIVLSLLYLIFRQVFSMFYEMYLEVVLRA